MALLTSAASGPAQSSRPEAPKKKAGSVKAAQALAKQKALRGSHGAEDSESSEKEAMALRKKVQRSKTSEECMAAQTELQQWIEGR